MPLPTFAKAGMTTLTFSRGNVFPSAEPAYEPVQVVGRSYAGTRRVATMRGAEQPFLLTFERLPAADYVLLLAWFLDPDINWSAGSFTFTNHAGVAASVWYAGGPFEFPQVAPGLHSGRIPLVKDVA